MGYGEFAFRSSRVFGIGIFDAGLAAGPERTRRHREASALAAGMSRGASRVIEGRAVAVEPELSAFEAGARIFHQKFGPGNIVAVDGVKLTIDFDKAGRKLVQSSFVSRLS